MTTIYDQRYVKLVEHLVAIRESAKMTQVQLAKALQTEQSAISKVETFDRRLDIIELFDWIAALGYNHEKFLREVGWLDDAPKENLPALPVPGKAEPLIVDGQVRGAIIEMAWRGSRKEVSIEGMTVDGYLKLETRISKAFRELNTTSIGGRNAEVIFQALQDGIHGFPDVNPSDIYHHIVYRLYLREYSKTQADRSWARAGGQALELFLTNHYNPILKPSGISLCYLSTSRLKEAALREMGIQDEVGASKLDIALYGQLGDRRIIFGGIHVKASLAERVSDDIPCSKIMMKKGFSSFLLTLDAKSFPPPKDLVNIGELGSLSAPSDKRGYIESHGDFSACFSYNLRSVPSGPTTASGRKIYVSTFNPEKDFLPKAIVDAWIAFQSQVAK